MSANCPHCAAPITPQEAAKLFSASRKYPRKAHDPNDPHCRCVECRASAKGKPRGWRARQEQPV